MNKPRAGATAPSSHSASFGFVALLAALSTLSPFAMDTYVPALAAVGRGLAATPLEVQQTLSVYMLGLGLMALWHGAISDALGRRRVMLVALAVYTLASLGCALSRSVHGLIGFRLVQGLAGGAGMILARAMIRDRFEGAAAQRLLSSVMLMFGIAPAIAPIIGGWLHELFGWRSIFWLLFAIGCVLTTWSLIALPETLPQAQRTSLRPRALAKSYWRVFISWRFQCLAAMSAFSFQVFFQYVGAANALLKDQLGLSETQFGYLFVPAVVGFMIGSALAGRVAGKWRSSKTITVAFAMLWVAALFNVLYHTFFPPSVPPSIAPILVGSMGIALLSPVAQLMVLDLFPDNRGLAASCQAFAQMMVGAVDVGFIALALSATTLTLALGMLGWTVAATAMWVLYLTLLQRGANR